MRFHVAVGRASSALVLLFPPALSLLLPPILLPPLLLLLLPPAALIPRLLPPGPPLSRGRGRPSGRVSRLIMQPARLQPPVLALPHHPPLLHLVRPHPAALQHTRHRPHLAQGGRGRPPLLGLPRSRPRPLPGLQESHQLLGLPLAGLLPAGLPPPPLLPQHPAGPAPRPLLLLSHVTKFLGDDPLYRHFVLLLHPLHRPLLRHDLLLLEARQLQPHLGLAPHLLHLPDHLDQPGVFDGLLNTRMDLVLILNISHGD